MEICIICEKPADKNFSEITIQKLTENLQRFDDENLLNSDIKSRLLSNGRQHLEETLRNGSYKYHKTCYDSFNETKFQRAMRSKKRKLSIEGEPSRSTRTKCSSSVAFAEELCMFCGGPEIIDHRRQHNSNPLHAAAGHFKSTGHVEDFTEKMKDMASKMGDTKILNLLSEYKS